MSHSVKPGLARTRKCFLSTVAAVAFSCIAMAPTQAQDPNWTPTGFDEHSRAAWAAIVDFCGADMPERPSDEANADLCSQSYEISLLYLATLLAWSQLPSSDGGMTDMQVFPEIDADWQARVAAMAADIEPTWTVEPNPDILRAPASVRPMLIDTVVRSYGTVQRLLVTQALINDP